MKVGKHKVVSIDYTLKDDDGTVIDSSQGGDPLAYIHGTGNIIPGLENALEGREQGENLSVSVAPGEGYGDRDDAMVQVVPRHLFEVESELQPGMQFQAHSDQGVSLVTITAVEGDQVTVDANHPLAGQNLHFDVTVVDVRDASEEELDHGHVHGPGGHQH
jgi:FKBP-type peptidyl-prolyl cis-trans isomerase SlyD